MKQFLFGLLALFATAGAFAATTYTYTGTPYTAVTGAFTTSQRITGSFTTATPLAPNLASVDVTGQVTSYSFSDGINSYVSSDSNTRVYSFLLSTDASGSITDWQVTIEAWESGTSPHSAGDLFSFVQTISAVADYAYDTLPCTAVGTAMSGVADACIGATSGTEASYANGPVGSWTRQIAATSIPTLSEWGMILLSSLLALGTVVALRRSRQ